MTTSILIEHHANWCEIRLNRPDRLNAFDGGMHRQLRAALADADADSDLRAVLLTGEGRAFCAGQDLAALDLDALGDVLTQQYNPLLEALNALQKPLVVAVNGVAAGAGANIALAGDLVFAAESARFIQSFANLGLIPDAGGTWTLTRTLGPARARGLAMTAEPITARQALEWGLIWKVLPDDELMAAARAQCAALAAGPTQSYLATRQAVAAALVNDLPTQLRLEADLQQRCAQTDDFRAAVAAFLAKQPPRFQGR